MKLSDWNKVISNTLYEHGDIYRQNMEIEQCIVNAHALENRVSYDDAHNQLASQKQVILLLLLEVSDCSDWYHQIDSEYGMLQDLTDIGKRAIQVFEEKRPLRINITNVELNPAAVGGWFGTPWDPKLNYHVLSDEYKKSQKRFQFDSAGFGDGILHFTFGYQERKHSP